jgi:hypothetical protein
MVKRRTDANGRTPVRRDLVSWLLLLLPGFMFVGLLAPAAVSVQPIAQEGYGPVSFRSFAPRRPLQVPLTLAHAMLPDTTIGPVFAGARVLADQAIRTFDLDMAAQGGAKQIVLAKNEEGEGDSFSDLSDGSLFAGESGSTVLTVDFTPLWDPSIFDVIPGLVARSGYTQWDDFHGTAFLEGGSPPAVPEPTTGALLALGLLGLGLGGRKRA